MDIMDIMDTLMIPGITITAIEIMHILEVEHAEVWVVRAIIQEVIIAHQHQHTAEEYLLL